MNKNRHYKGMSVASSFIDKMYQMIEKTKSDMTVSHINMNLSPVAKKKSSKILADMASRERVGRG